MKNARSAPQEATDQFTTDIFAEPIVRHGFSRFYVIIQWPPRDGDPVPLTASVEFSADVPGMQSIEKEAQRLITAGRFNNAKWETVPDKGGAPWRLGELLGARPLIVDLVTFAETKGFRRLPFPL